MEEKSNKRKKMLEQMFLNTRKEVQQQLEAQMASQGATPVANAVLDVGDQSVQNHETDRDLALLQMKNQALKDIDEALLKLSEDRYGICEQCGSEISAARLKALPFARYCVVCKEQQELFEKIEKSRTEA
jgi:DnaK suppressor protein